MKRLIPIFFTLSTLFIFSSSLFSQEFAPWVYYKDSDYARMREKISKKEEPYFTAWNNLLASPQASLSYGEKNAATAIARPGNFATLYRDAAAVGQLALIYRINGDERYGNKVVNILNNWAKVHKELNGNAERYLISGYSNMFANAAQMVKEHPDFDVPAFQKYLENVFYKPKVERFLIGNEHGSAHNDACCPNYRGNWNTTNQAATAAIAIFCDRRDWYEKGLDYFVNGCSCNRYKDGNRLLPTGQIDQAVPFIHTLSDGTELGQWEESGRDQGHTIVGFSAMANFLEIMYNQGDDLYAMKDQVMRKAAEYIARYNVKDENGDFKYTVQETPYTGYGRFMGSGCTWHYEASLDSERYNRGSKAAPYLPVVYNHYAHRAEVSEDKVRFMKEALDATLWGSIDGPDKGGHADAYDNIGFTALTHTMDPGSSVLPWLNMDIFPVNLELQPQYGKSRLNGDKSILTVEGAGSGIGGTSDEFQFAFQFLPDNGIIETDIAAIDNAGGTGQVGLMIRQKLNQNSENIFLGIMGNEVLLTARHEAGGQTDVIATKPWQGGNVYKLQLTYNENLVIASVSANGTNWEEVGRIEMEITGNVFAGPAVSSQNKSQLATAQFSNLNITKGNIRPNVYFSPSSENLERFVEPANISINANITDSDGQIEKIEVLVNNEVFSTINDIESIEANGTFSHVLEKLQQGTYEVSIRAYDDDQAVTTSDPVTYVVNPKQEQGFHFRFDESSGSSTSDANAVYGVARLYGASFTEEGKCGNAVSLSGDNSYVRLPANIMHNFSEFTISFWAFSTENKTWARLFDFGSNTWSYMFLTVSNSSNNPRITFSMNSSTGEKSVISSRIMPVHRWVHLAVTLSENDHLQIYMDGVRIASDTKFTSRPYDLESRSTANYIGRSQFESDPYFKGLIDDFRLYSTALDVDEIAQIMDCDDASSVKGIYSPVNFYPNPTKNSLTIEHSTGTELTIYNTLGKKVMTTSITEPREVIDVSLLIPGVYFMNFNNNNGKNYRHVFIKE